MTKQSAATQAQSIQRQHGTSYYLATQFFPKELREATYALYAFVRISDDIVDEPGISSEVAAKRLKKWISAWQASMDGNPSDDPMIEHATELFKRYKVPRQYGEDFLAAMLSDTQKKTYTTYEELRQYMYGSAVVVGLMMTHLTGTSPGASSDQVRAAATALGEAMQLTNFLRDIDADYQDRQRIYLPLDELAQFRVSTSDIAEGKMSAEMKQMMQFQISRARTLFEEAEKGLHLLPKSSRRAIRLASKLYAGILTAIEAQDCNPFAGRARVSNHKKALLILKHYWR
jgi:phytoene synthase